MYNVDIFILLFNYKIPRRISQELLHDATSFHIFFFPFPFFSLLFQVPEFILSGNWIT